MGCVECREKQAQKEKNPTQNMESDKMRGEILKSASTSQSSLSNFLIQEEIKNDMDIFDHFFQKSSFFKEERNINGLKTLQQKRDQLGVDASQFPSSYLFRFLRAKKYDIKNAEQMFERHIEWKKQNNIDSIAKNFVFWESDQVQHIYPHGYHKTDKQGRPIYIEILKDVTFKKLYEITTQQRMKFHYYQIYERLIRNILPGASKHHGEYVGQAITILDAKNAKLNPLEAKKFVELVNSFSTDNYPDILGKFYVVNSPPLVQVFWKIISLLLNDTIRSKVEFLGKDYSSKLQEQIDKKNLPDFLGGLSNTQNGELLKQNIGPWNDFGAKPLFPHQEEIYLSKVSNEDRMLLKSQIDTFWKRKEEIQKKAQELDCASSRQSTIKASQLLPDQAANKSQNAPNVQEQRNI